jgi:hypothetical protein
VLTFRPLFLSREKGFRDSLEGKVRAEKLVYTL